MFCIHCGVELADSEACCPLCGTEVYHPSLERPEGDPPYPPFREELEEMRPAGARLLLTVLCAVAAAVPLVCEWQLSGTITWAGYAAGGVGLFYVLTVLPLWFARPNPVVFVPVDCAAVGVYLLYLDLATEGGWFLSFALPLLGAWALLLTTVITLCRYVGKGYLYIFGGSFIALGGMMLLLEFLLQHTFGGWSGFVWSIYPLAACCALGLFMIFVAICRPLREALHKKLFL